MLNRKKQTSDKKKARDKAYREAHKEEKKAYRKAYYEAHKEELKVRSKAYREAHKGEKKAYDKAYRKAYYEAHREEEKARSKAYHEARKEEEKAYQKAYTEAHKEEKKAHNKAYYEAHKEELKVRRKAYRETHKEEKKAHNKAYRERKKRERESGLIGEPRQKRQRISALNDGPIVQIQDSSSQTNMVTAIPPASIPWTKEIKQTMIDSVAAALDRGINPEPNLPEQNNVAATQQAIAPQVTSYGLLFGNTNNNPQMQERGSDNHFYRNPQSARQLLFGDRKQTVSLGPQELGRAKLPSEEEREENFINNLFNF